MALDFFASIRTTALAALVSASFSSPIIVKSDAFANASARLTGKPAKEQVRYEQLVAGGVEFEMPETWGRLASSSATAAARGSIGTVVSGLCPAGSSGATCTDGTQVTFIAYSGKDEQELPTLADFEDQLDARLTSEFRGFAKGDSKMAYGTDGMRYLDYSFTYRVGKAVHAQRYAVYRHGDGSGVVSMVTGGEPKQVSAKGVDGFFASAHVPVEH